MDQTGGVSPPPDSLMKSSHICSSACDCDNIGARDNNCERSTGQCLCLPNVFGQHCDQCQRGFWGFPNCQPCRCNNRADECDQRTGDCLDCRDNTGGVSCERYIYMKNWYYYRDLNWVVIYKNFREILKLFLPTTLSNKKNRNNNLQVNTCRNTVLAD